MVLLVFAAGKNTVFPLTDEANVMNKYGCCSQALVFPRQKAWDLMRWYREAHIGFVDTLTERYADEHGEIRLALVPPFVQHIGRKSSKGGDDSSIAPGSPRSVTEKLWNFRFEQFDTNALRAEHKSIISGQHN